MGVDDVTVGAGQATSTDGADLPEQLRRLGEYIVHGQARNEARFDRLETDVAGLKTDVAVVKSDVAVLKTDVADLKTDVAVLKTDVAVLKTDVAGLKTDVAGLKTDVAVLKTDVADLKTGMAELNDRVRRMDLAMDRGNATIMAKLESWAPHVLKEEQTQPPQQK
jgi:cell division protein FtsB